MSASTVGSDLPAVIDELVTEAAGAPADPVAGTAGPADGSLAIRTWLREELAMAPWARDIRHDGPDALERALNEHDAVARVLEAAGRTVAEPLALQQHRPRWWPVVGAAALLASVLAVRRRRR